MSTEVKAWKCDKCGTAYINQVVADNCCKDKGLKTCKVCGVEVPKHRTMCDFCLNQQRFEKAKKVKYSEYQGWLYDDSLDEYFSDKQSLQEKYDEIAFDEHGKDAQAEYPMWCYGCVEIPFKVEIDSALERASEEMGDDFSYEKDITDLQQLYDFVKEWNAKQTSKAYEVDYNTVVLLNE